MLRTQKPFPAPYPCTSTRTGALGFAGPCGVEDKDTGEAAEAMHSELSSLWHTPPLVAVGGG